MIEEVALLTVSIVVFKNKAAEIGELCSSILKSKLDVRIFLVDNSRASRVDYADGKFKIIYINQLKQEESWAWTKKQLPYYTSW